MSQAGVNPRVMRFRRERSRRRRVLDAARAAPGRGLDAARAAPARGRELRKAVSQLDVPWARSWPAGLIRENFMNLVLNPLMDYYAARRATGKEKLDGVKSPVILVANHASHLDTPVILSALPRKLRKRTVVAAAADYFYRNRVVASLVSLIFNTVPIERRRSGGMPKNGSHLDKLLDQGWSLLLYPEGTRSRDGMPGPLRRGAAVLAAAHHLTIVPIRVTGTAEAMPPGRFWPKRLRANPVPRRHRIEVSFGEPITATGDADEVMERVRSFFRNGASATPYRSPYRHRATVNGER
jgi:1-acyl-sn-glycerol-3-phosphate acyltransferase